MQLRDYQKECIDLLANKGKGRWLVQMATGLGKTVTFANIERQGRMLILSHREELVRQPLKYFECSTGVEMADETSNGEEVVSASVQTLVRRLSRFKEDDFDIIVVDEAHHSAAPTYRKILDYFRPRQILGFTATPNRGDKVRLDDVYEDIVYEKNLLWGIENHYLCDIECKRANIGYDLRSVRTRCGDFAQNELAAQMDGTEAAIAEAYRKYARGATLIFASSVRHAENIAKLIPDAVVVKADTQNRAEIIQNFTDRKIPCLVNCMIFTEGTDLPLVETVIIARPTQSDALYAQMVGRGLRLCEGKKNLLLIDCVGVTGKRDLCTAPSLLGINLGCLSDKLKEQVEGNLLDLPAKVNKLADNPRTWIESIADVVLWSKENHYDLCDVNYARMPDGSFVCSLPDRVIRIPCPDAMGNVHSGINGKSYPIAEAFRITREYLDKNYKDSRSIWDSFYAKKWGKQRASYKQISTIRKYCGKHLDEIDFATLTKMQAYQIITRIFYKEA